MKAREIIPKYDIDQDELHKAAYLQRAVDKYNSKYQTKKPMSNPNNPNDATGDIDDGSPKGVLNNFKAGFQDKIDKPWSTSTFDKSLALGKRVRDWAIADQEKSSSSGK